MISILMLLICRSLIECINLNLFVSTYVSDFSCCNKTITANGFVTTTEVTITAKWVVGSGDGAG